MTARLATNQQNTIYSDLNVRLACGSSTVKARMSLFNQISSLGNLDLEAIRGQDTLLVCPFTLDSMAQVLQLAYANKWSVVPSGQGSKLGWGRQVNSPQIILSTKKLNKILEHAVSELTVTVESGVLLKDLQFELAKFRQFLPIDPAYADLATLGGIVSTADTGSYRQGYGSLRDLVLGLSWLRSDGQLAKAGSKVVKNVAGYDLMKLLSGSYGPLGVLTSITFRLYPLPADSLTLVVTGQAEPIKQLAQKIYQSSLTPTMFDLLSKELVTHLGLGEGLVGLILRWQTIPESIAKQKELVIAQISDCQFKVYTAQAQEALWQEIKSTIRQGDQQSTICKIGISSSNSVDFLNCALSKSALGQIHFASGVGYLKIKQTHLLAELRSYLESNKGFLTVLEGSRESEFEPWGYQGNALEMMRKIKEQFDPHGIFSPGRFIGNI